MFKIISLILISLSLSLAQECKTPQDCYNQANIMLNKDRSEIRTLADKITNDSYSFEQQIKDAINDIKTKIEGDYLIKLKNLETAQQESLEQVKILEEEIAQMKLDRMNKYFMYKEAIIYQNIFEPLEKNIISKVGNPVGWDDQSYRVTEFNKRKILQIGTVAQENENGLKINVPEKYNVLWIRVLNDRHNIFRVRPESDPESEKYACSFRGLNEISPDGTTSDSFDYIHKWCPIPLRKPGAYMLYSDRNVNGCWLSGIAFSKNLWNHAKNSGLAYHWQINGGSAALWNTDNWNNDVLAMIPAGQISEFIVPVVPSGKDKLLYIFEHNNNWDGVMHTGVSVNDQSVERFRTSYLNPFSIHINSKLYSRYIALRIPKEYIPEDAKFVKLKIDMQMNNNHIHFREIGTHDFIE
jgi:hypothetical protein